MEGETQKRTFEEAKVIIDEVIADKLAVELESIATAETLKDLGADSLDEVEVLMEIETRLNFEIPDEEAVNLKTIQDIYDYARKKVAEQQ